MEKLKVYYTDYNYQNKEIEKKLFNDAGIEVVFADKSLDRKNLIEFCKDADGIVTTYTELNEEFLSNLSKCKILVRSGIGYNNIDVEAATKRNIMVANVRNYCVEEVANHAMALTLALIRRLPKLSKCVKEKHSWTVNDCRPIARISELKLCCYGLGAIGKDYAKKAQAFGMKVYAFDPYVKDEEFGRLNITKIDSLEELAKLADVFSVHTPLTEGTKNSVDDKILRLMKPSAFLINVSRGGIVDEKALMEALLENRINGAGLDVLESEHPDLTIPLVQHENVLVTPHVAYYSDGAERALQELSAQQAILALTKGEPEFFVNKEQLK